MTRRRSGARAAGRAPSGAVRSGWAPAGDATTLLTVYVVLLFAIPSRLVLAQLGGAGTPAQLVAMGLALWFTWHVVAHRRPTNPEFAPARPVRRAMLLWAAAVLLSYVAATTRPISSGELRIAELGLLTLLAWLGVTLVAADGVLNRDRLDVLLRRLVLASGCVAVLGVAQFATGRPFTDYIQIPGFSANAALSSIGGRDGFARPAGTALHAIELGVVLTMLLPLALHYAWTDLHRGVVVRWFPPAAVLCVLPLSISRSALVGMAVGLAMVIPGYPRARRRLAMVAAAGLAVAVFVVVPGLLGTLLGLFTGINGDASAQSRTGSYGLVWEAFSQAPWAGRGFSTWLPQYRILDNQYLVTLIETGFLGVLALLGLLTTCVLVARRVSRASSDIETQGLAQALVAGVVCGAVGLALFDGFSFPMTAGVLFLLVGCVGALARVAASGETATGRRASQQAE